MLIRAARLDEVPLVLKIMLEAFEEYRSALPPTSALNETEASIRQGIDQGERVVLAFVGQEAVGSVRYAFVDGLYFHRLAVRPDSRGKGIGTEMVRWLEKEASRTGHRRIWLRVRATQPKNVEWYEKLGYVAFDEVVQANPNGEMVRTVHMEKHLAPADS